MTWTDFSNKHSSWCVKNRPWGGKLEAVRSVRRLIGVILERHCWLRIWKWWRMVRGGWVLDIFGKETQADCSELKRRVQDDSKILGLIKFKNYHSLNSHHGKLWLWESAIALFSNDGDKSHCEDSFFKELEVDYKPLDTSNRTQLIKFHTRFLPSRVDYFMSFFWRFSFTLVKSRRVTVEGFWRNQTASLVPDFKSSVFVQTASY